ncbi:MAG: cation transporter [Solirubrobacterales bacterium]|jgi:cobalt-zinc-cadmium efflux system protein|nr:cation transporter [Solirubrobacterales bacterium]
MADGHPHAHGHHHGHAHSHAPSADADRGKLTLALALIAGFMVVEVVAGLVAGSVALLSDAAHMLTDAGAIGLALVAIRLAARPASAGFTFGLKRAEVLSAQLNGAALLVLGALLAWESVGRLGDPPDVEGGLVVAVGALGALVNVAAAWALAKAERQSLNVEGARQHVLTDLYGSLAAIAGGLVVVTTGVAEADPIAALVVVALMLRGGWGLLRASSRVLLEAAPEGVDTNAIGRALCRRPGIVEVHDLHVWELTTDFTALSAHVLVAPGDDCHARRRELERVLRDEFHIEHTTLQVDHEHGPELLELG